MNHYKRDTCNNTLSQYLMIMVMVPFYIDRLHTAVPGLLNVDTFNISPTCNKCRALEIREAEL